MGGAPQQDVPHTLHYEGIVPMRVYYFESVIHSNWNLELFQG